MEKIEENKPIIEVMKKIVDPEIGVDIWTLGLIYDLKVKGKKVNIYMTFTSPMCPYGQILIDNLTEELKKKGFEAEIEIVFEPLWEPSEELKEILGIGLPF
ncbi:DUF59 domain-containing protein [Candidatus Woesearchaeota archaeon]|nr:MAG: DUF59 domain-containing protein [Candidatus Woesearchaeota archaeon]